MAIESATFITQLVTTNPEISDAYSTADDHIRLVKACVKNSFNNISSEMSANASELNQLVGVTANVQTQLSTANILANDIIGGTATVGNAQEWEGANKFIHTASPTSNAGADGDIWFRYEE